VVFEIPKKSNKDSLVVREKSLSDFELHCLTSLGHLEAIENKTPDTFWGTTINGVKRYSKQILNKNIIFLLYYLTKKHPQNV